jgi:exonuclease SbcC
MIFSQLFSPNYKSVDPDKRLKSIENLDKDLEKDKRILHELAFNDDSEVVSLAALHRLNSFVLWMKSAEKSSSRRIRKQAQQVCLTQLEDEALVPDKLFFSYVKESKNKPFLEKMLFSNGRLLKHESLSVEVLLSLNNMAHVKRFFQEYASTNQQMTIVNAIDDAKILNKLIKFAKEDSLTTLINTRLAWFADLAEKPNKIKQQMTMINSRLLALKEAQDYEYLSSQLDGLSQEFEQVKPEFNYLDEVSRAAMTEKYLGLKVDIQQRLEKLEQGHKSQLLLKQTTNDLSDIEKRCYEVKAQIDLISGDSSSTENINSNIDAEVKILSSSLKEASSELDAVSEQAQTQAHKLKITQLNTQISSMQLKLTQVFDIIEYAQAGSKITLELSTLVDSLHTEDKVTRSFSHTELTELQSHINTHKHAFEQLKESAKDLLPNDTLAKFSGVLANANALTKQFSQRFKELERKCENKLKTVNRMISDGKFKPAMSTFSQAHKMFTSISEHAPGRLQKAFEQTELEVNKLQDWQSYIAQPRKPAIVEKALQLANSSFEDPYERAEQVKQLRQEYNSLGLLNTSEDEAYNKSFDEHIEKAFVPCRAFFAELERQRELNYQKALGFIEEAKGLSVEMPASELASKIGALKTQFNKLGDIEKTKVHKVRREFTRILKPLGAVISNEQSTNAEQKQSLIKQANKLNAEASEESLLPDAIEKAKGLQQNWKKVGFAGKNIDNQLWNEFRQSNDALFEKYHQSINNKKTAQQQQFSDLDSEITSIEKKVKSAKAISDLQFYDEEHSLVSEKIHIADDDIKRRIQQKLRALEDVYAGCVKQLNKARSESAMSNLFAFLQEYNTDTLPAQYDLLIGRYKSWVKGDIDKITLLQDLHRDALTQVAAILFDIAYNDVSVGEKSVRQELQLKMMASKMQGDDVLDTQVVLAQWVSLGPVKKSEQESLQAMQQMYIG